VVASVFDLFKIGVGPSSSHTMGPMTAACDFVESLAEKALIYATCRIEVDLYGSLALTGKGHATDRAILLGLSGQRPDILDPDTADIMVKSIRDTGRLELAGKHGMARRWRARSIIQSVAAPSSTRRPSPATLRPRAVGMCPTTSTQVKNCSKSPRVKA
jgi:hypothetical protein